MRAQRVIRPAVVGALTGFAFVSSSMLGQALAADVGGPVTPAGPVANAPCVSLPKSAALDARIVPLARADAHPTSSGTAGPSSSSTGTASPSDTASPSPSDSTGTSASPTSTPSDSPTADPSPSTGSTSPSSTPTPSVSPTSATPTPTPTPSQSTSPTPAPKPKTPQLCVRVQSLSASQVRPGSVASFVVWVWSTKAQSNGVAVTAHVASATAVRSPVFRVCPQAGGTTCKIGDVPTGLADELQVTVRVGKAAALGEHVRLTAKATAAKSKSFSSSATDAVVATLQGTSTGTGVPGVGALPPVTLPPIPGVGSTSPGDPSGLFPTVGPSATPPSTSLGLPPVKPHKTVRVTDAAETVPLDSHLIGAQLAGLAVLAGAVVIAITRLSLRKPKVAEDKASEAKTRVG